MFICPAQVPDFNGVSEGLTVSCKTANIGDTVTTGFSYDLINVCVNMRAMMIQS